MDLLGQVSKDLSQLEQLDPSLRQNLESLDTLIHQVDELARALRNYRDGIEYSPERLHELEERLNLINGLKRKYGGSIGEILAYGERAAEELETLDRSEERAEELKSQETDLRMQAGRLAGQLSEARQHAATRLAGAIQDEVAGLALGHAEVVVDIRQSDSEDGVPVKTGDGTVDRTADGVPDATPSSTASATDSLGVESIGGESVRRLSFSGTGVDSVEFLISLNPGEPPRPLARIASGGEASRLMLAIKTILSAADQVPILVFDEIDAGVGGRVGSVLGQKLWGLSQSHQVLCVTHLPQIAVYADHHAKVTKMASHDRTVTSVEVLDAGTRVTELSQMLGSESGATRTNALEMLQQARSWKEGTGALLPTDDS